MTSKQARTHLPVEIWNECFAYLAISDHKMLSLTCRLFHDICLATIFRTISYSSSINLRKKEDPQVMQMQLDHLSSRMKWLRKLANSPKHVAVIRKCKLSYSLHLAARADKRAAQDGREAYTPFVDAFVECLPLFVRLKTLEVEEFTVKVDKRILLELAKHPSLEEVVMSSVRFGVHLLKPRIKLRNLSITNEKWSDANPNPSAKLLDVFSGESLESLCALTSTYCPKLFRAFTKQGMLERLRRLSFRINTNDFSEVHPFLKQCPNVESIELACVIQQQVPGPFTLEYLPLNCLRRLKSFTGPALAAKAFVPQRPVTEVRIEEEWPHRFGYGCCPDDIPGLFASIARSTGPLLKLVVSSVECSVDVLRLISDHFPHLEELHLGLRVQEMFPGEDPQDIELPTYMACPQEKISRGESYHNDPYDDPIHGGERVDRNSKSYLVHLHTEYMVSLSLNFGAVRFDLCLCFRLQHILHWLAHKRVKLPSTIKALYLNSFMGLFFIFAEDDDQMIEKKKRAYSGAMAQAVFRSLSVTYPAFEAVGCGNRDGRDMPIKWTKRNDDEWTYVGVGKCW